MSDDEYSNLNAKLDELNKKIEAILPEPKNKRRHLIGATLSNLAIAVSFIAFALQVLQIAGYL